MIITKKTKKTTMKYRNKKIELPSELELFDVAIIVICFIFASAVLFLSILIYLAKGVIF